MRTGEQSDGCCHDPQVAAGPKTVVTRASRLQRAIEARTCLSSVLTTVSAISMQRRRLTNQWTGKARYYNGDEDEPGAQRIPTKPSVDEDR